MKGKHKASKRRCSTPFGVIVEFTVPAVYYHRRPFQANGPFGAFGAVTIDRRPKAALQALAEMYGGAARE
jgi:hypothetical protein